MADGPGQRILARGGDSVRGGHTWNLKELHQVPQQCPFSSFFGGGFKGSATKIDYRKKVGTLILTSLLEDPVMESS